ncbi:beta-ketoacyl synthase N-terminal-like domain-containing protein [Pseudomonas corrugata]
MSRRRVVVTGMGMLSPLGTDAEQLAGHSAGQWHWSDRTHRPFCLFHPFWRLGKKGFNVEEYLYPVKEARKLDLFIQYGLAAGFQAVRNAGLEVTDANRERIRCMIRGRGDSSPVLRAGPDHQYDFRFPSIHLGAQGPNYAIATACTTGTHCIGMAARNIMYDEAT